MVVDAGRLGPALGITLDEVFREVETLTKCVDFGLVISNQVLRSAVRRVLSLGRRLSELRDRRYGDVIKAGITRMESPSGDYVAIGCAYRTPSTQQP